jgi:hypothetical protein
MRHVAKQIESLRLGDLVRVEWTDASIGKSIGSGNSIDVPVLSWGIYLGCLGEKSKHIILAQNCFRYSNGVYDIDYTAIPVSWSAKVTVLKQAEVDKDVASSLLSSFLQGRSRTLKRRRCNH